MDLSQPVYYQFVFQDLNSTQGVTETTTLKTLTLVRLPAINLATKEIPHLKDTSNS